MTWADLIAAVRAQIDVSDDQAYAWLLDRARVLNAESAWLLDEMGFTATDGQTNFAITSDAVSIEALIVNGYPYRRSTMGQMDIARSAGSPRPIYAEGVDSDGARFVEINPPLSAGNAAVVRFLGDVPDNRAIDPPFPSDIQGILADGAIAVGLARMDERFDSAGYFDAKFADAIQRLKRRRHSHVGRGGTPIRLVT
jgi:hypothetical protein